VTEEKKKEIYPCSKRTMGYLGWDLVTSWAVSGLSAYEE
jgi:hypothetical protein